MTEKSHQQQTATGEHHNEDTRLYAPCLTLECRGANALGEYYLLTAPLSLRPDSYDGMRGFLANLISHFVMHKGCAHESYVALHQTKSREIFELFADHAPAWLPETILGVWTNLPAPCMMTSETLMEMDPRLPAGTRMYTLFRVTTGANACLGAMATMTGTGTGIQIVSQIETEKLLNNLKELFLDFIKERIFRIFPWYVPLLRMKSLEEPITALTEQALTGITLYIRESPEDGGILILSREPLEEILLHMGCQRIDLTQGLGQWRLPE
ncbi:MAG: hypothetical protein WBX22_31095 [Silvibacterium sp.]